ncbi:hypothetical protein IU433_10495 [Nocardia puris]|uniref:Uncharacterized protein n=1 Tax=Nocardia puris TaxID=208602 RepID=A0A366DTH6_9NOCA|nr:hypothetical protein [Nocardia puris]MBF6210940.1 hypothetical protein [Nocardia puris]MBF6364535.1 hypothetical protein [Nocardia puris]MBF6459464.1 hypothetical protein [Nocardia puris]RBO92574.1 hypothetical protein DFR74_103217 [Nocardia puris]
MDRSRARIAGPAAAVGAVSLGLVVIGSCGIGGEDVYVPPPPLPDGPAAAAVVHDGATITGSRIVIPPSPTWQVAPEGPPRRPAGFVTMTVSPDEEHQDETTRPTRPGRTTTPPADVDAPTTTTRTRTLSATPTAPPTTEAPEPTTRPTTTAARPTTTTPEYENEYENPFEYEDE